MWTRPGWNQVTRAVRTSLATLIHNLNPTSALPSIVQNTHPNEPTYPPDESMEASSSNQASVPVPDQDKPESQPELEPEPAPEAPTDAPVRRPFRRVRF